MARKKGDETDVRGELLRAAWELLVERGYDATSVNAVIERAGLSKGTFYHYYDSRDALLDALVMELQSKATADVRRAIEGETRGAVAKLDRFLTGAREVKLAARDRVFELTLALFREENAAIRRRWERASSAELVPLLASILDEGMREGTLSIRHPDETASIVVRLVHSQREEQLRTLLTGRDRAAARATLHRSVEAFYDALERIVGAPTGSLTRPDRASIEAWLALLDRRET